MLVMALFIVFRRIILNDNDIDEYRNQIDDSIANDNADNNNGITKKNNHLDHLDGVEEGEGQGDHDHEY